MLYYAVMKTSTYIKIFSLALGLTALFAASSAQARIDNHGFYFVEDDYYNMHYMSELSGANNVLKLAYDHMQTNPQVLANQARQNKYSGIELTLGLNEELFSNTNGARDLYLQNLKKYLYQDSDMGSMVIDFHILEEEYTLLRQGFFDNWTIFQNLNVAACQAKYGDWTLNRTNCMERMMKEGLESYIRSLKYYFPNIPVAIVENYWGQANVPPSNLDILGLDAYYIPSAPVCDTMQRVKFDNEVTSLVTLAKQYNRPIQMVGGVFDSGPYNMLIPCQAQWYLDLAKNTPEVTSFNWFMYADADAVRGVRNNPSGLVDYLKNEGRKILDKAPTNTAGSISNKIVNANSVNTYSITVSTSDANGADDIKVQYTLINQLYQGVNGGQFRGYLGWSKDADMEKNYYFPGISGSYLGCAGGGFAAKAVGYGEEYINLIGCSTSYSGNIRTTVFTVSFNLNFKTPTINNLISVWAADSLVARSGWQSFDSFSLLPNALPTVTDTYINSKPVVPNGTNQYVMSVTSSDGDGINDIKVQYLMVNQTGQGPNTGYFRGYLGWTKDGDAVQKYFFPGVSGSYMPCAGGGLAAKAVGYGEEYINLISCSTTTSGNSRTTYFTVSFNKNFTTPVFNNVISGWSSDAAIARSGWQSFYSFTLAGNSAPVIVDASINSSVIKANGSYYTIIISTSDADGAGDVKVQYALINQLYQGVNGGQFRGYLGWSKDADMVQKYYFPGISGSYLACAGGGFAAKAVGYGEEYMNLIGCTTNYSGNIRTTVFWVSFNPNFTSPASNNTVSGWSADAAVARSGWQTFGKFSVN